MPIPLVFCLSQRLSGVPLISMPLSPGPRVPLEVSGSLAPGRLCLLSRLLSGRARPHPQLCAPQASLGGLEEGESHTKSGASYGSCIWVTGCPGLLSSTVKEVWTLLYPETWGAGSPTDGPHTGLESSCRRLLPAGGVPKCDLVGIWCWWGELMAPRENSTQVPPL